MNKLDFPLQVEIYVQFRKETQEHDSELDSKIIEKISELASCGIGETELMAVNRCPYVSNHIKAEANEAYKQLTVTDIIDFDSDISNEISVILGSYETNNRSKTYLDRKADALTNMLPELSKYDLVAAYTHLKSLKDDTLKYAVRNAYIENRKCLEKEYSEAYSIA